MIPSWIHETLGQIESLKVSIVGVIFHKSDSLLNIQCWLSFSLNSSYQGCLFFPFLHCESFGALCLILSQSSRICDS